MLTPTYQDAGIKSDKDWSVTGSAPQSTYTPIIQQMKTMAPTPLSLQAVNGVVQERQEATLQGFTDPKVVWECTFACYYAKVFTDAGSAVDGEYIRSRSCRTTTPSEPDGQEPREVRRQGQADRLR